ncbi:MAG TPA: response regulator [Terriglobales bacterium]|nr:response regulator [Terriglobales bacterium]
MDRGRDSAIGSAQMQLLVVGNNEEDFTYLRDLLSKTGDGLLGLDHAHSPEEALARLAQTTYDLLLCDYKSGDGMALHLLHALHKHGLGAPVIFLSDHVDEAAVETAIKAGACECVQTSSLNGATITRAIRYAIDVYCKERQRQKAEDTLRKLWRAVEQSADLVMITDLSGVIEYVNPAFEALTGYSPEEAIGQTPRLLKSGQQPPGLYQELWETILSGGVFRGILVNRKKNGELFFAEKTITPLRDAEGRITHFISNDRDITERRRLESQLQQAQKMDAIGRLAGGVAHDFNNLLMVISAYAELMQDSLAAEHPLRRNVQEIMTASRRAADLTRQLLAFGRKQMQSLQILDLNWIIQDINKMLPRLIGEDIQLVFVAGRNLGKVKADPVQIEQVVMNLAANARDAMPHGGKLTIETASVRLDEAYVQRHSIVPAGDYVLLAFTDTGQGIAPEHIAHIFEPFYTTKEEGKGTGLGLATVYGIVKQNGGFIWVYSEPGIGTTFKIYLPRVQQETGRMQPLKLVEESPQGCETLLLVEDEAAVRQSAREFLTLNGYTVLEAKNGEDALYIARDYLGPIDLMITDVVMPHLGGAKLAGQLATERPNMKVLFVSGYAENTVLRHGAIDVTNSFLQKPFSLKALARKIREVLQTESAAAASTSSS